MIEYKKVRITEDDCILDELMSWAYNLIMHC